MKLFKKVLSAAAVFALVVAAVPANAFAASDVIDFEDGSTTGFSQNLAADGVTIDGDNFKLTVEEFNGSSALFIDVQDTAAVPKLAIDVPTLVGAENLDKVRTVEFDFTLVNPTGEAAGWNGGSFGANIGADGSQWYDPADWTIEDYENATTETSKMSDTFVKGMGFTSGVTQSKYLFMKWANGTDFYIDNVRFLDADGKAIPIVTATAATTDDTAAATDETAASTDDAAAVDTATTTDVPKTGTPSYALFFLAGAAVMLTGAVVVKNRKSIKE